MRCLITDVRPQPGDLVLARVDEIGKQARLELTDGRKATMFPGDEIVVCYGHRYAPDQYESVVGHDLSPCDLVASGGIASNELCRRIGLRPPTQITPIGLVGDSDGHRLNVRSFRVDAPDIRPAIPAILSLGTSMNAGKTLTATSIVRGFKRLGFKVGALKVTGTGSGGDMWIVQDAGADISLDFTDAGYASTYLLGVPEIELATYSLMNYVAAQGCDIAVIEIADGLQQLETSQLIRSERILDVTAGTVFASYDAMGAKYGVDVLREANHNVLGISGRLGLSPLGVREAEDATGLRFYSPLDLQEGALAPVLRARTIESGTTTRWSFLSKLARMSVPSAMALSNVVPLGGASANLGANRLSGANLARDILERTAHHVMNLEADAICGASFGSRATARHDWRNGFKLVEWTTDFGRIELRMPRLKHNQYFPSFVEKSTAPIAAVSEVVEARSGELSAAVSRLIAAMSVVRHVSPEMHDELVVDIASLITVARRHGLPVMQTVQADGWSEGITVGAAANGRADDGDPYEEEEAYPALVSNGEDIDSLGALFQRNGETAAATG